MFEQVQNQRYYMQIVNQIRNLIAVRIRAGAGQYKLLKEGVIVWSALRM